jgi:hypothetical protein
MVQNNLARGPDVPAPPPIVESPPLAIEDAKTVNGKPIGDPLGEAFENFERALRQRSS